MKQGVRHIFQKFKWWLVLPLAYLLLKCLINPEPVVSIDSSGVRFGLFNFYNISVKMQPAADLSIKPLLYISAYETNIDGTTSLPPWTRSEDGKLHIMGTDHLGRDVFAGFVAGLEIALILGFAVSLASGLLSLLMGAAGSYFGRFPIKVSWVELSIWWIGGFIFLIITSWWIIGAVSGWSWLTVIILVFAFIILARRFFQRRKHILPVSSFNRRIQEFFQPLPDLVILLVVASIFDSIGFTGLIIILISLRLPTGAWYLQGQAQQFVYLPHIDQAKVMGIQDSRIIVRHLAPMMLPATGTFMSLTAARAVLAESALSFLGIGPTGELMSWGSMIRLGLSNMQIWWVALFPVLGLVGLTMLFRIKTYSK
ncbi:MAG TPA: ABC transporter permease subunit [Saprospiraceae bacterium]|nr:ABC transporter permease subunit [Saprospiraceae bacterium]